MVPRIFLKQKERFFAIPINFFTGWNEKEVGSISKRPRKLDYGIEQASTSFLFDIVFNEFVNRESCIPFSLVLHIGRCKDFYHFLCWHWNFHHEEGFYRHFHIWECFEPELRDSWGVETFTPSTFKKKKTFSVKTISLYSYHYVLEKGFSKLLIFIEGKESQVFSSMRFLS